MQKKRLILFLVMIVLGIGLGLAYGWIVNPINADEISPSSLRADYKADYVLMVAEIYQSDSDLDQAAARLALLGSQPPGQIAAEGLRTAMSLGYTPADLSLIENLSRALQKEAGSTSTEPSP